MPDMEEIRKRLEEKLNQDNDQELDVVISDDIRKMLEISIEDIDDNDEDLDVLVQRDLERQKQEQENLAELIASKLKSADAVLYNKEDIMQIFSCESDKALRMLRLCHQMKFAVKIGKEYYISKEDFETFLTQIKGRNTII